MDSSTKIYNKKEEPVSLQEYFISESFKEKFTNDSLTKFYIYFIINKNNKIDKNQLNLAFEEVLKIKLNTKVLDILFQKVDKQNLGFITIYDFISYLRLEYEQMYHSLVWRSLEEPEIKECKIIKSRRFTLIRKIGLQVDLNFNKESKMLPRSYITVTEDGFVDFWSLDWEFEYEGKCVNYDLKTVTTKITDMIVMSDIQMICTSSVEMNLQFYDISGDKFLLQKVIHSFPNSIVAMNYYFNVKASKKSYITLGDTKGNVIMMMFKRSENVPFKQYLDESIGHFDYNDIQKGLIAGLKVKEFKNVHYNFVNQIKYYRKLRTIVSCTNSKKCSLVVSNPYSYPNYRYIFTIKKGVTCFDICAENRTLVTGGIDQIARIWALYNPNEMIAQFTGHIAQITAIFFKNDGDRLFTFSRDKCLKIWNVKMKTCQDFDKFPEDLQLPVCTLYNDLDHSMILASSQVAVIKCQRTIDPILSDGYTHDKSISQILYNKLYKMIVTTSLDSSIKVWHPGNGNQLNMIKNAHWRVFNNKQIPVEITAACFDYSEQFLITGGRFGELKIWDFNLGTCLRSLNTDGQCITEIKWLKERILCAGWNCRIIEIEDIVSGFNKNWKKPHTDDIVGMVECNSKLLITASYNGELVFWNLNINRSYTKSQINNLIKKQQTNAESTPVTVRTILFLKSRFDQKEILSSKTGTFIVSLDSGILEVWTHHGIAKFLEDFSVIHVRGDYVESLATDPENDYLFTGFLSGYIKIWLITNYLISNPPEVDMSYLKTKFSFLQDEELNSPAKADAGKKKCPMLLSSFKGHNKSVVCLEYIPKTEILISGSTDCTVRLWTVSGQYLYTLGTNKNWIPLFPILEDKSREFRKPADIERTASFTTLNVFESGSKYYSIEEDKNIEKSTTDLAIDKKTLLFTSPLKEPILGQYYKTMGKFKNYIAKPGMDTSIHVPVYTYSKTYEITQVKKNQPLL